MRCLAHGIWTDQDGICHECGEPFTAETVLRVQRILERIDATTGERRLRWATKLWNAIDCMESPEVYWQLMLRELPDCFDRPSVNCLRFTY